jgi:Sec7-like guanine-nucleotide exchange factor
LQAGIIEESSFEAIAAFLFTFRDVFDRKTMGDYLSTRPEDQKPGERDINAMLYAFVRNIDFTHIDFDLALRYDTHTHTHTHTLSLSLSLTLQAQPLLSFILVVARRYLYCFHLPGEAQKIDRLVQKFAEHYYSFAQDLFQSSRMSNTVDNCYMSCIVYLENRLIKTDGERERA